MIIGTLVCLILMKTVRHNEFSGQFNFTPQKKNIGINELGNELSYMAENRGKTAIYKLDALCPDEWNREYTA